MGIWSRRRRLRWKTKKSMETYSYGLPADLVPCSPEKKKASSLPITGGASSKDKQFVWKNKDMALENVSTCRKKCCMKG